MKKNKIKSIRRALVSINQYRENYGFSTALRVLKHYSYRAIKNYKVNPNESIIMVNGCKMYTKPDDPGISTELSVFKSHEPLNTKILSKILKQGMTCIDIGGNIGYYVLLERKFVGTNGKIIAIEPLPQNFEYLNKNIKLHNFKNIFTFNFACGDKDCIADFYINKKSNGCQLVRDGAPPLDPSKGIFSKVQVKKLDSLVEELKLESVDFIRMDVEGYELNILKGVRKTLEKFKPIISLELHKRQLGVDGTKEFFKLMKDLDYEIESYAPRELDIPLIGTMSDVKKPSIDELVEMIENKTVGSYLMLNLINRSNK